MTRWEKPRRILCIRPDNMGDLLMSAPAISALKETFDCEISLLTSSAAKGIASLLPTIDECLVWDVPWVKGNESTDPRELWDLTSALREKKFDAAVIFTVFSQNPLPTAMLPTLAGIPNTLAYCRENPYQLLTHWLPDEEPYTYIQHQVRRDLKLVAAIGAHASNDTITLRIPSRERDVIQKLAAAGVDATRPWVILHPGASERKREYPSPLWIEAGKGIANALGYQMIITGVEKEKELVEEITSGIGPSARNLAGMFSLEELIALIRMSPLLVSVNTGTVHIAAAVGTRLIVLYALTNPQHAPWKAVGKVLPYSVPENMQSKNAVLRYVQDEYFGNVHCSVKPEQIVDACYALLIEKNDRTIPELITPLQREPGQRIRNTLNLRDP